jgi:hypothetical protein
MAFIDSTTSNRMRNVMEVTVLSLKGVEDDARAEINVRHHGIKWLARSVAKLTLLMRSPPDIGSVFWLFYGSARSLIIRPIRSVVKN